MDIYVYTKSYFKETKDVQKAILAAIDRLYERICIYERENISFHRIFNDDTVKYDKHGEFYTYKIQRHDMQIRLLYTYMIVNGTPVILIADYVIKKKNNKRYIERFDKANHFVPSEIYKQSYCVAAV